MNEELKLIIGKFLKISHDQISDNTIIDTTVLKGSILFHRMISRINDLYGIEIKDYSVIKTYKDLIDEIDKLK
tara:strand:- start:572 stop:790 length:219 start_codon:yes stop_codon:yes gene_type:complete